MVAAFLREASAPSIADSRSSAYLDAFGLEFDSTANGSLNPWDVPRDSAVPIFWKNKFGKTFSASPHKILTVAKRFKLV